jgi:hypothetical protein
MEDYEVKDILHRASTPVLDVAAAFQNTGSPTQARLVVRLEWCDAVHISFTVANLSNKPADYAILTAYVDVSFALSDTFNFQPPVQHVERFGVGCQMISANLGLPGAPPLFREFPERAGSFGIGLKRSKIGSMNLIIGCDICTPGYIRRKKWLLQAFDEALVLGTPIDEPIEA